MILTSTETKLLRLSVVHLHFDVDAMKITLFHTLLQWLEKYAFQKDAQFLLLNIRKHRIIICEPPVFPIYIPAS